MGKIQYQMKLRLLSDAFWSSVAAVCGGAFLYFYAIHPGDELELLISITDMLGRHDVSISLEMFLLFVAIAAWPMGLFCRALTSD